MKRLAALLVGLYPPAFRERFGDELAQLLDDLLAESRSEAGPWRTVRVAADLVMGAAAEWRCTLLPLPGRPPESPSAVRPRLRAASPQRTAAPPGPAFTPLPGLRRRHGGRALPARAASF